MLTYLRAQSLHHVTEEVIQLFALNIAVICQDIEQPLIRASSSASVCAFSSFRHSRETVFI